MMAAGHEVFTRAHPNVKWNQNLLKVSRSVAVSYKNHSFWIVREVPGEVPGRFSEGFGGF